MSPVADPGELERTLRDAAARGAALDLDGAVLPARLLRELLTGDARGVKLSRATIDGLLDLESAALTCPLQLDRCRLGNVVLSRATGASIRLVRCELDDVLADQLTTQLNLDLSASVIKGRLSLRGARIGAELRLNKARLRGDHRRGLDGDDLRVEQGAFLQRIVTVGGVYLARAHIGGRLQLDGAELRVKQREGSALRGDRLYVGQGMFCRDGFTANGVVRLPRAQISGQLSFRDATLTNPDGAALYADGLRVDHTLRCDSCVATGALFLVGAAIGGALDCGKARLRNERGPALDATSTRVDFDARCDDGFVAEGEVRFARAQVKGDLVFEGATLSGSDVALDLGSVKASTLDLRFAKRPAGTVNLVDAELTRLRDSRFDGSKPWPRYLLDGCRYTSLEPRPAVKDRLEWLDGSEVPGHVPLQPYEQLAAVYRADGDEAAARTVSIAGAAARCPRGLASGVGSSTSRSATGSGRGEPASCCSVSCCAGRSCSGSSSSTAPTRP